MGARFVAGLYGTDQTSPDLEIPSWAVYLAIPLGSYLMCFRFLQVAWAFWKTGELPRKLDPKKAETMDIAKIEMSKEIFEKMHAEDKMANDKLKEGIEGFTKAIVDLEKKIAERLS